LFAEIAPNIACSGRFATFRLGAFSRSKTLSRFVSWFAWQHAANASRQPALPQQEAKQKGFVN
jgi:hypothetical protein